MKKLPVSLALSSSLAVAVLSFGKPAWSQTLTLFADPGEVGTSVPNILVNLDDESNTLFDGREVDIDVIWEDMKHVGVNLNPNGSPGIGDELEFFAYQSSLFFQCFPLGDQCFSETEALQLPPPDDKLNFLDENGESIPVPMATINICAYGGDSALCNLLNVLVIPTGDFIFHGINIQFSHAEENFLGGSYFLTQQPSGESSFIQLSDIQGENDQYTIGEWEAEAVPEPASIFGLMMVGGSLLGLVSRKAK